MDESVVTAAAGRDGRDPIPVLLLRAAHPVPALAVTVLAGLLAVAVDLPRSGPCWWSRAVLTGQLSIGWSNDLVDRGRDRAVGRTDKPLATGAPPSGRRPRAAVAVVVVRPSRSAWPAGWPPVPCTWSAPPPAGPTTSGSSPPSGPGCRTPSCFGGSRCSSRSPTGRPACRRCGCRSPVRCSGSAPTSSTCCPTSADDAATGRPRAAAPARRPVDAGRGRRGAGAGLGRDRGRRRRSALAAGGAVAARGRRARRPWRWSARGRTPFRAAIAMALVDVAMLVGAR